MTYQDDIGQNSCKACNSICQECDKETGKCTECDAGYGYNSQLSMPAMCTMCEDGQYSEGGTSECLGCLSCDQICN